MQLIDKLTYMKFKLPKSKNESGFTLIELLVVVIVISALSGIVVSMINSGGFRDKAQDSQRIANLKQIQTALELHFSDFRKYPDSGGGWLRVTGSNVPSPDIMSDTLSPDYINTVPTEVEPKGTNSGPCASDQNLRYNYRSDGTYYILTAIMAVDTSNDNSECTSLNSWGDNCGSMTTADVCYGVENP